MAPSATTVQSLSSKAKRPIPPGIQTNGIHSSASSPSPSMSAGRLPNSGKPPNSAVGNGAISASSGVRSTSRVRRETPSQLLGRGQRNSSVGLRSASIVGESAVPQTVEPTPYIKTDEYILKKYRNSKPSLIVHLHATHFRFDQQEGSFSYKSPMKCLIEHLKKRTIPHELVEFMEVPYYEGCMIVQIHNHKAATPSQEVAKKTGGPKTTPFSVHNYNTFLTPSPYVPYPTQSKDVENDPPGKAKTAEQKDQENMPAPSLPGTVQSGKSAQRVKISTIVLHPTPLSEHMGLAHEVSQVGANNEDRRDSRVDGGPLSATVPPTPTTGVPPTPSAIMAPPAKRVKKTKVELDATNIHAAEAQITLTTTAGLVLDPVSSAAESAALLQSLAHPMHSEKPPSPKTRKRTVAEMAADEALAAEQERYMLILDERLSSNAVSAQGGGNPADGDGQAGGASFEPRFERFKTLENIKAQHEENKRNEQIRQQEAERKAAQDREREAMRLKTDKAEADKQRQIASQAAARQQQEMARRQQLAAQQAAAQQGGIQGIPPQLQNQHGHPQANPAMVGGNLANANRFHQQVSQAAASSPIVRNGTPQSHSSPMVNNMGNVPMQTSTSSMGGSPPRPGSVVHQNQPQMGAPGSHPMATQRSQQSHAGTPRMPNSTPIPQNTPLNRQMNQTPRMSQASPIQGSMAQAHGTPIMMQNGQMMTPAQAQQLRQQQQVQQLMRQSQQNAAAQGLGVMPNGQPMNAQQQAMLQAQLIQRQQQQQGIPVPGPQLAQGYANHMANMAQRGMQPGMNPNFVNNPNMQQMNMQQLQQMQQMQMRQAQVQQQQQAAAQAQAQAQVRQQPPQNMQQQFQQMIRTQAAAFYRDRMPNLQAQHPGGIPSEIDHAFRMQCQNEAQQMVAQRFRANQQQRIQAQAQMMAQAGMQQNMNGMQNGMGM